MTWLALALAGSPEQLMEHLRPWLPEVFEESGYAARDPAWLRPLSCVIGDSLQLGQALREGRSLASAWELWEHGPLARALIQAARQLGTPDPDLLEAHLLVLPGRLVILAELDEPGLAAALAQLPRLPGPLADAPRVVAGLAELGASAAAEAPAELAADPEAVPPLRRLPVQSRRALTRLWRRRCDGYSLFVRAPVARVVAACTPLLQGRCLRELRPGAQLPRGARRHARRALFRTSRAAYRSEAARPVSKPQRRFVFVQLRGWTQLCEDRGCLELEDSVLAAGLSQALAAPVLSYRRRDRDGFLEIQAFPAAEPLLLAVGGHLQDDELAEDDASPELAARHLLRRRIGPWLPAHYEDLLCRPALEPVLASALYGLWGPSAAEQTLQRELDLGLATAARLLEGGEPARALELLRAVVEREPHLEAQLLDLLEELQWLVDGA